MKMLKKTLSLALVLVMVGGVLVLHVLGASGYVARPTEAAVYVNGADIAFEAYNINGNNYFRLRDLAFVLSGTEKQFEVVWDIVNQAILLTSGVRYTVVGGEMDGRATEEKTAAPTSAAVFLDGRQIMLTAYHISGNNYFRLRDVGQALDFGVDWDSAQNTVFIDTSVGYTPENGSGSGNVTGNAGAPWTQTTYTAQDIAELKDRTVFFAHNSVGQNIIDGIKALDSSIPIFSGSQAGNKGITENYMGFNGDPLGKLEAFENLINGGANNAQIAMFKLCYADFQAYTDVDSLFSDYVAVFDRLGGKYPDVTFVHVTAPLYHYNASWNNRVQHSFNEKLRAQYGGLVFDLAAIESVDSAGNMAISRDGVSPALAEEWTSDGSHLNASGGRRLASAIISFLAQAPLR